MVNGWKQRVNMPLYKAVLEVGLTSGRTVTLESKEDYLIEKKATNYWEEIINGLNRSPHYIEIDGTTIVRAHIEVITSKISVTYNIGDFRDVRLN